MKMRERMDNGDLIGSQRINVGSSPSTRTTMVYIEERIGKTLNRFKRGFNSQSVYAEKGKSGFCIFLSAKVRIILHP